MNSRRAILSVTSGPNEGDTLTIEQGSCRLIGRHLSESETAFIDRDGNRLLDAPATEMLEQHLKDRAPETGTAPADGFSVNAFERGPDIVLADDSISRAHAMVFFDPGGLGVIDLASTNGTLVNGDRVGTAMVTDGDSITIGSSEMVVKLR
jgi:hypothetical protein